VRTHRHILKDLVDWFNFRSNPTFGDVRGGNYTEIEDDGTLVFHGDAVVYEDLRFPSSGQKNVGSPTPTAYKGGQVLALASNVDQGVYFAAQIPHAYKLGSEIEVHLHIVLPTAGAGAGVENLKFDFTYSWANISALFPTEETLTVTVDVQNYIAHKHYVIELGDIDGTGKTSSSMMICSLTRDTTVADDYASSIYLLETDFHYQIDTVGSRQEYIK